MARSESPEVCFLGRSNVGKSSLLNALLGGGYANVSSKPGRTKMMNAFEIGNSTDPTKNLVVLDMPGYGKGGQADWGKEILKYLGQRKQLKRAFVLVDAEVGLKKTDEQLLAIFRKENIPHQIVLSKVDKLLFTKNRMPSEGALNSRLEVLRQVFDQVRRISQPNPEDVSGALGEIIASCSNRPFGQRLGINELRHSMLQAAELQMSGERKLIPETEVVPHEVVFGSSEAW
jgi:GTP-binding protein